MLRWWVGGCGHINIPFHIMLSGCHGDRLIWPPFATAQQPLINREVLGSHLTVCQHTPTAAILGEGREGRGGEYEGEGRGGKGGRGEGEGMGEKGRGEGDNISLLVGNLKH